MNVKSGVMTMQLKKKPHIVYTGGITQHILAHSSTALNICRSHPFHREDLDKNLPQNSKQTYDLRQADKIMLYWFLSTAKKEKDKLAQYWCATLDSSTSGVLAKTHKETLMQTGSDIG